MMQSCNCFCFVFSFFDFYVVVVDSLILTPNGVSLVYESSARLCVTTHFRFMISLRNIVNFFPMRGLVM